MKRVEISEDLLQNQHPKWRERERGKREKKQKTLRTTPALCARLSVGDSSSSSMCEWNIYHRQQNVVVDVVFVVGANLWCIFERKGMKSRWFRWKWNQIKIFRTKVKEIVIACFENSVGKILKEAL